METSFFVCFAVLVDNRAVGRSLVATQALRHALLLGKIHPCEDTRVCGSRKEGRKGGRRTKSDRSIE